MLDDHFLFRQFHRPASQGRGDDHRQHFRRQPHGNRERKQRRFPPVTFGEAINQQYYWRHYHHKADKQHTDAANPFLERIRLALLLAHAPGQLPKPGVAARGDDHRLRRTAHHVGAHKTEGVAFQRVGLIRCAGFCHFFYWQGFAGQRRLCHEQVARLHHTQVSRDHVACRQFDDIARNQLVERDLHPAVFPLLIGYTQHRCSIADHRLERIRRFGGSRFLNKIQESRDGDH